jgi:hypothetical protein
MEKKTYTDETLICKDCGKEFIFTAGEQEFYDEKGFDKKPQRCKPCRDSKKNKFNNNRNNFNRKQY